jgi:small subunit ribosomal protein S16
MLKIRLQRVGRRNEAAFRVVLTESTRGPKSGDNVELLGVYSPHTDEVSLKKDRISHWIQNGAQVSDTVHNLLVRERAIEGKKINVLPKKSPIVKEEGKAEEKAEVPQEEKQEEKKDSEASKENEKTEESTPEENPPTEEVKDEKTETLVKGTTEDKPKEKAEETQKEEINEVEKEVEKKEG